MCLRSGRSRFVFGRPSLDPYCFLVGLTTVFFGRSHLILFIPTTFDVPQRSHPDRCPSPRPFSCYEKEAEMSFAGLPVDRLLSPLFFFWLLIDALVSSPFRFGHGPLFFFDRHACPRRRQYSIHLTPSTFECKGRPPHTPSYAQRVGDARIHLSFFSDAATSFIFCFAASMMAENLIFAFCPLKVCFFYFIS